MNIKRIRFLAASFTVMLLLNSCAPASEVLPDQAKLFEEMYPQEAERYAELAPVSLTYMNRTSLERHMVRRMVIETVREKMDDPDELRRYLNNIETYNDHKREEETDWIESLSSRLHEDDRLYFFNYKVGDLPPERGENYYSDFGIMVVRDGEIVYREKYGLVTSGTAAHAPDPERVEFDNL